MLRHWPASLAMDIRYHPALIRRSAWRRRIAPHAAMTLVFLDAIKALEKRNGL